MCLINPPTCLLLHGSLMRLWLWLAQIGLLFGGALQLHCGVRCKNHFISLPRPGALVTQR